METMKSTGIYQKLMETYESMKINENRKFLIPKQFIIFPDFTPTLSEAVGILVQAYVKRKCKF